MPIIIWEGLPGIITRATVTRQFLYVEQEKCIRKSRCAGLWSYYKE